MALLLILESIGLNSLHPSPLPHTPTSRGLLCIRDVVCPLRSLFFNYVCRAAPEAKKDFLNRNKLIFIKKVLKKKTQIWQLNCL